MLSEKETVRIVMQTLQFGTLEQSIPTRHIMHWRGWTVADRGDTFRVYNQANSSLGRDIPQHSELGKIIAEYLR